MYLEKELKMLCKPITHLFVPLYNTNACTKIKYITCNIQDYSLLYNNGHVVFCYGIDITSFCDFVIVPTVWYLLFSFN